VRRAVASDGGARRGVDGERGDILEMAGGGESRRSERGSGLEGLALFALVFAFWLALSGKYTPVFVGIGAACSALVVFLTPDRLFLVGRMRPDFGVPLARLSPLRLLRYGLWLLGSIAQANLEVARVVLHPRMPIEPRLLRFRVRFESRVSEVVLAHSITLTPGTVTIDLRDGEYLVHALVPRSADALASGAMQRQVAAAFGEPVEQAVSVEWLASIHDTGQVVARGPGAEGGGR